MSLVHRTMKSVADMIAGSIFLTPPPSDMLHVLSPCCSLLALELIRSMLCPRHVPGICIGSVSVPASGGWTSDLAQTVTI